MNEIKLYEDKIKELKEKHYNLTSDLSKIYGEKDQVISDLTKIKNEVTKLKEEKKNLLGEIIDLTNQRNIVSDKLKEEQGNYDLKLTELLKREEKKRSDIEKIEKEYIEATKLSVDIEKIQTVKKELSFEQKQLWIKVQKLTLDSVMLSQQLEKEASGRNKVWNEIEQQKTYNQKIDTELRKRRKALSDWAKEINNQAIKLQNDIRQQECNQIKKHPDKQNCTS